MSIAAQCPHCETRFNLQPEMNGKSMRCPNLECRQVFTVKAMEAAAPAPSLPPEPPPQPKAASTKPPKQKPVPPPPPPPVEVVDAVVVEAEVVSPPKVKEVVWSEGTDVPPPKSPRKPAKAVDADEPDPDYIPRRKKKKFRGPLILAVMGISTVAIVVFAIFYIGYNQMKAEEKLALSAKEHYDKGEYSDAVKSYEKLAVDYPDSKKVDEYKFFHDLASMQTVVRSVTNSDDYDAAIKRLHEFIGAHKDSPLAKPKTGYALDIREAGKKLGEDIAKFAEKRVAAFTDSGHKNAGELVRADKAIADGRELLPALDPFRGPDDPPLKRLQETFDTIESQVKHQRARIAALDRARRQLASPTDAIIQSVLAELQAAGFIDDPDAKTMIAAAKGKLRDLVKYEDDPAASQPVPHTAASSLLFVTPVSKPAFREPVAGGPPPTVYLCVARGILYALEDDTGALLWATRVGPDVMEPPAVARVQLASGLTDVAVVTSNVGNAPAVAGHLLRSNAGQRAGGTLWYQPLPAPAAGPAVVVGSRAFVPIRDALGTVYEFDITTGERVGRIRIGQPVADRGATVRPGTSLLYVAADARRIYVIDARGKDEFGNRVNPRCLQVIATGHLPGTLRVPPLFVGPQGTEPAERWMVLAQASGTASTLLRTFPVEPLPTPLAEGAAIPETPAVAVAEPAVPGWITFAPVSDGERLAVITDTGNFRLFGIKQIGNADKALFPLPAPASEPATRPVPGLVIPTEESTYWMLAAGKLRKVRLALVPSKGQEVVAAGPAISLGEPVHRAQLNTRRDTACVVVRSLNSAGCRAVAFDLQSGEIRWQQQLGFVPAKTSADHPVVPVVQGDHFILVDEDGGILAVPVASNVGIGQTLAAPPKWVLASPPASATGPTAVAVSSDGKVVFALTPVNREGAKFVIRRVVDGKLAHEDVVNAPAALSGAPAVVGGELLVPTSDGFVNRLVAGAGVTRPGSLVAGPPWQGERRVAGASCSITPLSDSAFATSDGGKNLSRWEWPAAGKWNQGGTWNLHQAAAGPGVVLPPGAAGSPARLIVADTGGVVRLFAADRAGSPLRYWRPGGTIPAGRPGSVLAAQPADPSRIVVTYVVDGKTVAAISPEREKPLWAMRTGEDANAVIVGAPQPAGANRWVVTDLDGRVLLLDGDTGSIVASQSVGLQGAVPAAASGVAAGAALTPLSDGSAVVIELPRK